MTEHTFASWDGLSIAYRHWPATTESATTSGRRALLLFHRGHEHAGRWQRFVERLDLPGVDVFAWDERGHGHSGGERGEAPDFAALTRDADRWARHLVAAHGVDLRETAVVASSLGAVVAAAWVHDFAPPVRAMVLAAPAFRVKLYVPLAVPFLSAKERMRPGGHVRSFVRPSMLTADPAEQRAYAEDPLIFPQIAVNLLLDLDFTGRRLVDDAAAMTTPTLLMVAGNDWVVKKKPQLEFFRKLGSPVKKLEFFKSGRHALFHDVVAPEAVRATREFLEASFARPAAATSVDGHAASHAEYDLLRTPSGPQWKAMRGVVRLGGFFSRGIRLGWTSGFDSGETLDYVYANTPAGRSPLGRLIDRGYLGAIGWRGIRVRRQNLQALLTDAIGRVRDEGRPVHVLDVATGAGRYVLETLVKLDGDGSGVTAELRDYKQANLDAAAKLAESLGRRGVTFRLADAFDRAALASADPKPSVAIVSGLYELFPDNAAVRTSLAGLADAVVKGGYLIYTNQPWHPQVEFIARTLTNREGRPWVMRRRSQAEMDALVIEAGFEKVDQSIDRWGIFTVALARRVRA